MDSTFLTNNFFPAWLSFKCSLFSSLVLIPWGIFWGWILARKNFSGKIFLEVLLNTPLVLPPVLIGYILLLIFSLNAPLGQFFDQYFAVRFVLNENGIILAMAVVASPFMVNLMKYAFGQMNPRIEQMARSLGVGPLKVFLTVTMPLCWRGLLAGFFLSFTRSMGEFGATIILAGNIPFKTQTIPLAIFSHVTTGRTSAIIFLMTAAIFFSYLGLFVSYQLNKKSL